MVTHFCNPSYSGGGDPEDLFEASPGKKLSKPHFNQKAGHGGMSLLSKLLGKSK
jgi:hypothetical protein